MKKTIKQIVNKAFEEVYQGDLPLYGFETWNSGYIDDLTDEAIGIFRLVLDVAGDIFDDYTTESLLKKIVAEVKIAPDYTRYNDHHFILYWLDESACRMTVEYGDDDEYNQW